PVSETDIVNFVNLCGFVEPLFIDMEYVKRESVFTRRAAPGALTFALSEGLIMQTGLIHGTGMAFLGGELRIVAPVLQGDTIRVEGEIAEKRETKKPDPGIGTYRHRGLNQRDRPGGGARVQAMTRPLRAGARGGGGGGWVGSAPGGIGQLSVSPGGLPKQGAAPARAGTVGLEGDTHRNTRHHGGPERALCLFAMEAIRGLQGEGHRVAPGV